MNEMKTHTQKNGEINFSIWPQKIDQNKEWMEKREKHV